MTRPVLRCCALLTIGAVGCGASSPVVEHASVVAEAAPEPVAPSPPRPMAPTARAVLIDGVRGGAVLDERDGWRLVSGAGTVALVGADGHVRASHRFAYGSGGARAIFGPRGHALVENLDGGGQLGPLSSQLHHWDLDADTLEQLAALGYNAPSMARLGEVALAVLPEASEGEGLVALGPSGVSRHDLTAVSLRCEEGPPPSCTAGTYEQPRVATIRLDPSGALVIQHITDPSTSNEGEDEEVAEEPEPPPRVTGLVPSLGARGIHEQVFAPRSPRLLLVSPTEAVVLGPDGISPRIAHGAARGEAVYESAAESGWAPNESALLLGGAVVPFGIEPPQEPSRIGPVFLGGEEGGEISAGPVCSPGPRARCVRARREDDEVVGWEVFDPRRPSRALVTLELEETPEAAPETAWLPAGAQYLRAIDWAGRMSLQPLGRGEALGPFEQARWAEVEAGWAWIDVAGVSALGARDRAARSLELDAQPVSIQPFDAEHVLVRLQDEALLVRVPELRTERTFPLASSEPVHRWYCTEEGGLRDEAAAGAAPIEGACPLRGVEPRRLGISADRAFWSVLEGEEARVTRSADGAVLLVRLTTDGVLASAESGAFEATGAIVDHVVVREPGPVLTAALVAGAEARARFERPGLVAAFFAGRALP